MRLHTADLLIENGASVIELSKMAESEINNFETETTVYTFKDGSAIAVCNDGKVAYFSLESVDYKYNSERSDDEIEYEMAKFY